MRIRETREKLKKKGNANTQLRPLQTRQYHKRSHFETE